MARDANGPGKPACRKPLTERRAKAVCGIRQHTTEAHTGCHHAIVQLSGTNSRNVDTTDTPRASVSETRSGNWPSLVSDLRADLLEALDGWLAVHEFAHRLAKCLEILCAAMRFDRSLIGVPLQEHMGAWHFAMIELIQQAALLVFVDLLDELCRDFSNSAPLPSLILIVATTPSIRVTPCFPCVRECCEISAPIATAQGVGQDRGADRASNDADVSSILLSFRTAFPQYGWKAGLQRHLSTPRGSSVRTFRPPKIFGFHDCNVDHRCIYGGPPTITGAL